MVRQGDVNLERRSCRYGFLTICALKTYFTAWIPEKQIDAVLAESVHTFRKREGISEQETEFQFLQKSEQAMLRIVQSTDRGYPYFEGVP